MTDSTIHHSKTTLWQTLLPAAGDPRPLAFFRIGVCAVALTHLFFIFPYIEQLFGNFGMIQWTIMETDGEPFALSIGKLGYLLYQWGVPANTTLYFVFGSYLFFLLGLLLGRYKYIMAIGAWLTHLLIVNAGTLSVYGVDSLLHTGLFYCMVMPVAQAWSWDQLRSKKPIENSFTASLSLRVLQCHLCIIYLNTGLAKALGVDWWTGASVWRAFMMPKFAFFNFSWLATYPYLPILMGAYVVVIELGYPLMIWFKFSRKFWLVGILLFHVGVAVLMGLSLFSTIMIWMNLSAFGFSVFPITRWITSLFSTHKKLPITGKTISSNTLQER